MSSDDEAIVGALCALDQGVGWLFTVAATWGSSPRPAGSLLLIDADGRKTGSVSGGCVEADLVERCRGGAFDAGCPVHVSYGVDADDTRRFGLPCGGRLDLIVERVDDPGPWCWLSRRIADRAVVRRRLWLETGKVSLQADPSLETPDFAFSERTACRLFGPRLQLVIIGAVHIARHLLPIAQALGYRVVVCDPRREHLAEFADTGVELDARMPDDCVRARADDPRSAVVALTHDPKLDDLALMEALTCRAFYVGALGSRRSQQSRRERLAQLGLPPTAIGRLHGPVGLDLGGKAPAEIAVAIAAELILCKNGADRSPG
ncbi:MAG: XdhC family protein [Thiohalocapsa sp.]